MAGTNDPESGAPNANERADVRDVLDAHGPAALATRIHVPLRAADELWRKSRGDLAASDIRALVRRAGRVRSAWTEDAAGCLKLDVDGLARLTLRATTLVGRDLSRPSGWLLMVDTCEPFEEAPGDLQIPQRSAIDPAHDLDAAPLENAFLHALTGMVEVDCLGKAVAAWLSDLATRWTLERSPRGPRGLHLVRLAGDLELCIEVVEEGSTPLRARFESPTPDPGQLLALLLPHLSAGALMLGPASIPVALPLVRDLDADAADRLLELVAERLDDELSRPSSELTSGLELSPVAAARCQQRWQVNASEAQRALSELLGIEGSVSCNREVGVAPTWTVTGAVLKASLRLAVTRGRLVVEELEVSTPPGCLFAADFPRRDQGFAPWTLIEIGDEVVDHVFPTHRRDRAESRTRLEHGLRGVGSLRVAHDLAGSGSTGWIDVGDAVALVITRPDPEQARLVTRLETPLTTARDQYRDTWLSAVSFMPDVWEWVHWLLNLDSRIADRGLESRWPSLEPRLGIDHPPGGRPDVSLWIEFAAPGATEGGPAREAHLALVADVPNVWRGESVLAVGFVGDPSLPLPAPDWLRDTRLPVPSVDHLRSEARSGGLR